MRLQAIKPRIGTAPGRLQLAATLSTQRLRGRAAVDRRQRYLSLHPLCIRCTALDMVGAASAVDHTVPLWAGGADDYETNAGGLCTEHHDAKTACEARMRTAGGWLSTPCTCGQHAG